MSLQATIPQRLTTIVNHKFVPALLLSSLFFLFDVHALFARPFAPGLIPNGNNFADTCKTCHTPEDDSLTGATPTQIMLDFVKSTPPFQFKTWTTAFANLDSDNDGFTNGEELQDATGLWVSGQPDPGSKSFLSIPADHNSTPPIPQVLAITGLDAPVQGKITLGVQFSSPLPLAAVIYSVLNGQGTGVALYSFTTTTPPYTATAWDTTSLAAGEYTVIVQLAEKRQVAGTVPRPASLSQKITLPLNPTVSNLIVNTTADSDDGVCSALGTGAGNQDCTLREAINTANAKSGLDSITFSNVNKITLNAPLPAINDDVTIAGPSSDPRPTLTISGANLYQVLVVNSGKTLNLQNLVIADGVGGALCYWNPCGGALANNDGTVNADNIIFSGNSADAVGGAIFNSNSATLHTQRSIFINNRVGGYGGAIINLGTMTSDLDIFQQNRATANNGYGGAIMNFGPLTVNNSIFRENSSAGGIGGAISNQGGVVNVANSTLANNSAVGGYGGGALYNGGDSTLNIFNSTFSGNSTTGSLGGGINNWGTLKLFNSIVADSIAGGDCVNNNAATGGHNLIEDASNACGLSNGVDGNLIGVDPYLVALGDSGMALRSGSPAIDAGDDAICAAAPVNNRDERGITRPQGAHCDMGAFEAQNNALALVKSADPLFYRAAGDVITYNYEITNIGATSVSGPFSIHDDKLGVINSCGTGLLNPGEKTSCTAPYNVTAQDMAGSTIINVAHAEDASGVTVSANVKAQVNKAVLALALKKRAVPTTYSSVGDLITYKYELKNESNVPLEAPFTVTDSKLGTITPCGNGPLAVGTTTDCIKTYAVTQADITAGSIINKAQALGGGAISTSATVTVTWQAAPAVNTTTALAASPNPSMRMQTVVLKATVTAASGTPAGKVTFLEGATALGSALLDANGVATLTLTTSIGTHDVTARYEGNSTFNPSSSNLVTQTVTKQETTFELRLLNNPAMLGTPIIFSVRLLPASQLQTGSVQFWHEGGLLGTVPLKELTDNVTGTKFRGADFSATNEITSGVHSIRVSYAGDLNFNTATSAIVTQTVIGKQKATLDLHSNPNPAALGTPITLSAQVFPVSDRQIGNVTFFDNDTALGTAVLQNSCGLSGPVCKKASLTTTALPVGNHILKAIYTGDSNYTAATSAAVTQTISSAPVVTLTPITLAVASGNKAMQLNWNATNDNKVTSYRLLRHAGLNARFAPIAENWLNGLYLDKDAPTNDLVPGLTYCYQVEALRKDGTVAMTSNEACKVFGVLELFVPDMLGRPGETVIVPVNIANADGLRLAASEIWLDFNSDIIESVAVSRTALTTGYAWASAVQQDGILLPVLPMKRLKIAFFSFQPEALHGNGSLFWLTFKVKGEPGQSSPLDLKEFITNVGGSSIQDFTNLGQDVPLQVTDGLLSVVKADEGYTLGDVDGDRLIRALDALRALGMAVGKPTPTQREVRTGDINGNNHMDSADASMILYYAAHGTWPLPPKPNAVSASALQTTTNLRLSSARGQAEKHLIITLSADTLTQIAGGDFEIVFDPSVVKRVADVTPLGLAANFKLDFHDTGNGLLAIALSNDVEISGNGDLLTIDFELQSSAPLGASPLTLASASLHDLFGRDFITSFANNTLTQQSGTITVAQGATNFPIYLPVVSKK